MDATINGNTLTITITMQSPAPSKSDKAWKVACSNGVKRLPVDVDGKPVKINLTAWIAKD